jgi:hypothetical protein
MLHVDDEIIHSVLMLHVDDETRMKFSKDKHTVDAAIRMNVHPHLSSARHLCCSSAPSAGQQ